MSMSDSETTLEFRKNSVRALQDQTLRSAMRKATDMFIAMRAGGVATVPLDEWRDQASAIRQEVLDHLPDYLDRFCVNATREGAVIYRAKDAETARETVLGILKDRGAHRVVKSKSMVTEEIRLNDFLIDRGMHVVETDLGEYIVQLAGEPPSHILGPALHKTRQQIGRLFQEKLGIPYTDVPEELITTAKNILRNEFLSADAGITGANFAVAETGSLVLFTNEGNGRMVTTLPPLHIAVFSLEKLIPSLSDLPLFMRLLCRSATGQTLSSYVSVITGTRKPGEATGAKELHIVLVDNGRSSILAGECREILKCIRCSACINVCPVYRHVGGHAYDSTYPGPMGIVLTTLLDGMARAHPLLDATTLCGACTDVCPVKVPLGKLLTILREQRVTENRTPAIERTPMQAFGLASSMPWFFRWAQAGLRLAWPHLQKIAANGRFAGITPPATRRFGRRIS
jgi:L-lactate dehydrogenase complex protein LldF